MKFEYPDGATPIDANAAIDLVRSDLLTQAQLNETEQANILKAQLWSRTRNHKAILSEEFIRKVHKRMFGDVWKWAGKFKTIDHENDRFAKRGEVSVKLRALLENTEYQISTRPPKSGIEWVQLASRFHHQLVLLHAFTNGNGRHAREMTDLLLLHYKQKPFSWGSNAGNDPNVNRGLYLEALKTADMGDYSKLENFVRS